MSDTQTFEDKVTGKLKQLYGEKQASLFSEKIFQLIEGYSSKISKTQDTSWSEKDIVLITYGDQIRKEGEVPLKTLNNFLQETGLKENINTIHILPFFPYSSDDGFSVIDYKTVDPKMGSWDDITALTDNFQLMFDFVLNHISSQSQWFQEYLKGNPNFSKYFVELEPGFDTSLVVRPRDLPLLTSFETKRGNKQVWTTFSADQIDLNFKNPQVLISMLDAFLLYLEKGARIIRLDAIAFLWKENGSSCVHLPQTHTIVKLLRDIAEYVAPGTIILTETNVPHHENISYFGEGDEANMVYQFTLPPLLLDAFYQGDAQTLSAWAKTICKTYPETTFFNFTASHDGIGVRPLHGWVTPRKTEQLIQELTSCGACVSKKRNPDGGNSPYEINSTYFDAFKCATHNNVEHQIAQFLASQAIALSLRGIPGIYFHSLFAATNDLKAVKKTKQARAINRRKYKWDELETLLGQQDLHYGKTFRAYQHLLSVRTEQACFHPDAPQTILEMNHPAVFAFERTSLDGKHAITVIANVSAYSPSISLDVLQGESLHDLISGRKVFGNQIKLKPYEVLWLSA